MQRLGAIFTAICMVLIAGSVTAALYLYSPVSGAEAAIVGVAVLTALALYNTVSTRLRDRRDVSTQIADLSRGTADLARQVAETTRRVAAMDGKIEAALEKARATTVPLSVEIGELGTLLKQLAEQVAAHETLLAQGAAAAAAAWPSAPAASPNTAGLFAEVPPAPVRPAAAVAAGAAAFAAAAGKPQPPAPRQMQDLLSDSILAQIRGAIDANRIDLYLQPIVTLPQRKVRYYEAVSRLRTEDGELVAAADFLPHAEAAGLMPRIDNLLLFRCVQVVRRLLLKNREIGLFCNISASTLADGAVFPQLLEFMEANRVLAPSLVFEFTQSALRAMGPIENESMAALAQRGFHFSMDNVTDLRMEGRDLSERGFRFVKAPAELLLNRGGRPLATDIHPADLSDLLGRFGVDLVAEKIESEAVVVDLLDHDVRYGQGFLFSPPRPVRQEALQGIGERNDIVAVDAGSAPGAAGSSEGERPRKPEMPRGGGFAKLARPA